MMVTEQMTTFVFHALHTNEDFLTRAEEFRHSVLVVYPMLDTQNVPELQNYSQELDTIVVYPM